MVSGINDAYMVTWPGADYFIALGISLILALALALALAAIIVTFGLIQRNTTPTITRFA